MCSCRTALLTTSKSARFLFHNNYWLNLQPCFFAHFASLRVSPWIRKERQKAKLLLVSIKFWFVSATNGQYTSVCFAACEVPAAYGLCVCERGESELYFTFDCLNLSRTNTEYLETWQLRCDFTKPDADIQKPSGGGKISHLITSADDLRLRGDVHV